VHEDVAFGCQHLSVSQAQVCQGVASRKVQMIALPLPTGAASGERGGVQA